MSQNRQNLNAYNGVCFEQNARTSLDAAGRFRRMPAEILERAGMIDACEGSKHPELVRASSRPPAKRGDCSTRSVGQSGTGSCQAPRTPHAVHRRHAGLPARAWAAIVLGSPLCG